MPSSLPIEAFLFIAGHSPASGSDAPGTRRKLHRILAKFEGFLSAPETFS